jgi:hypothetical protein
MNRIAIVSPSFATIGDVAGKPRPLIVKPAQRVVADPDDVLRHAVLAVVAVGRVLRLDDERAEQPSSHLVRRVVVGVVHVRAGRPDRELVGERVAGLDRVLRHVGDAVHRVREPLAMEVDAGRLVEVVLEDRPDAITLDDLDPRRRPRPVVTERVDRWLHRVDLVLDLVDRQLEDLHAVLDACRGAAAGCRRPGGWRPRRRGTA